MNFLEALGCGRPVARGRFPGSRKLHSQCLIWELSWLSHTMCSSLCATSHASTQGLSCSHGVRGKRILVVRSACSLPSRSCWFSVSHGVAWAAWMPDGEEGSWDWWCQNRAMSNRVQMPAARTDSANAMAEVLPCCWLGSQLCSVQNKAVTFPCTYQLPHATSLPFSKHHPLVVPSADPVLTHPYVSPGPAVHLGVVLPAAMFFL